MAALDFGMALARGMLPKAETAQKDLLNLAGGRNIFKSEDWWNKTVDKQIKEGYRTVERQDKEFLMPGGEYKAGERKVSTSYGRMGIGGFSPISGPFGTAYQPSYSPIFGYGGGVSARGGAEAGTITRGNQSFRPVNTDVTGFSKSKIGDTDTYEYTPSMAYVYANTPRPAPVPTPNVTSFLSTPTAMATPTGNYGAGRYLSGLLSSPITYGLTNDTTGSNS